MAARRGLPAIIAGRRLAATFRVAAIAGFAAIGLFTTGFDRAAGCRGFLHLLGRSGEGDAGGDAGDDDESKEGLKEFHQDLDFGFGSS